jgi:hypothetical protein
VSRINPLALFKASNFRLVSAIRLDGAPIREDDQEAWRHVAAVLANLGRQREARARWEGFAGEIGAPSGERAKSAIDLAAYLLRVSDEARTARDLLARITANVYSIEHLADDTGLCRALAKQLRAAASATRLAAAEHERQRLLDIFSGNDRTSTLVRQLLAEAVGNAAVPSERLAAAWSGVLRRLDQLGSCGC